MRLAPSRNDVEQLLLATTSVERQTADVEARRTAVLERIAEIVGGEGGFWGWGRGHPLDSALTPVVGVPFGFTPGEWAAVVEASLDDDGRDLCAHPIAERLRSDRHVTMARAMLWNDDQWRRSRTYTRHLSPIGWDDWLTSVKYLGTDSWCCLTLWRRTGRPSFGEREAALLDLALAGIRWLHPAVSEVVPPNIFIGLSHRQRMVMMFLLDGSSRKQIAANLGVTLHTVNDHVKAIYERFQVNSATELAARFLKVQ